MNGVVIMYIHFSGHNIVDRVFFKFDRNFPFCNSLVNKFVGQENPLIFTSLLGEIIPQNVG